MARFREAMQRAVGRGTSPGLLTSVVKGALSRVPRPAPAPPKQPPGDPGEMNRKGQAFRSRNAGPIKPGPVLAETDQTLNETGDSLRRTIGMMSNQQTALGRRITAKKGGKIGKPIHFKDSRTRYKEGGKVSSAMSALQKLAQQYKEALDMDDTEKATRIKRQMERMKRGSTKEADDEAAKSGEEKAATFAEGGKVAKVKLLWKVVDQAGKIRSVLEDEDKAFNLSDRINDLGRSKTEVVTATEEDLTKWRDGKK